MKLARKNVIVTGGNSGIGLGIAKCLAEEGATGAILARDEKRLESAASELNGAFMPIKCDVTRSGDLESAFKEASDKAGKLDVLVVNAGGAVGAGSVQPFEAVSEESFDAMTELNLKSVFFTVQKALPYLNDGASVILVSSIASHRAFPGMSVYSAAKAGVRALARTISSELLPRGIRVNVISPGTIDTPVFDKLGLSEADVSKFKSGFNNIIPMGRAGQPEEIGKIAAFLASSDASFVVGAEIVADGGVLNL